jgi:hypothetical protein
MNEVKRCDCRKIAIFLSAVFVLSSLMETSAGQRTGFQKECASPGEKRIVLAQNGKKYEATWESLAKWEMPKWLRMPCSGSTGIGGHTLWLAMDTAAGMEEL